MKVKRIVKYQNKLLKLKLIKTKVYKKKNHFNNLRIEDIEYRLKKALRIIYKYHTNNKKILFIGTPIHIGKKIKYILKNTEHSFIPESTWINGIITNQASCFKYLSKNSKASNNKIPELLFKLKNKSDLIVVFNKLSDSTALNEGYVSRIPIISLNGNLDILETKSAYKIPGNFTFTKKKIRDNFFFSLLIATFKKANLLKFTSKIKT
jgi:ribosomal protein S2